MISKAVNLLLGSFKLRLVGLLWNAFPCGRSRWAPEISWDRAFICGGAVDSAGRPLGLSLKGGNGGGPDPLASRNAAMLGADFEGRWCPL